MHKEEQQSTRVGRGLRKFSWKGAISVHWSVVCVPEEPYPPADSHSIIETEQKARHSQTQPLEIGDPTP